MLNKIFKKNYKLLIGLVVGAVVSASAVYVYSATYNADTIFYNNTGTSITANDVKGALDELNNRLKASSVEICYNGTCGSLSYRYWNEYSSIAN